MNTRVNIGGNVESQEHPEETDVETNREDQSIAERVISLVVPQGKLNVVSRLLQGIGVDDIRIKYLRLHWNSQSNARRGNYVSALEVERMYRLEFYADDNLARQAIRIFSTFLHMQFIQTGQQLPAEIEEEVVTETLSPSGDYARQRRSAVRLQARGHSDLNEDQHYLQPVRSGQNRVGPVALKRGRNNPDLGRFVEDSHRYFDQSGPATGSQCSGNEGREWSVALDNDGELEMLGQRS